MPNPRFILCWNDICCTIQHVYVLFYSLSFGLPFSTWALLVHKVGLGRDVCRNDQNMQTNWLWSSVHLCYSGALQLFHFAASAPSELDCSGITSWGKFSDALAFWAWYHSVSPCACTLIWAEKHLYCAHKTHKYTPINTGQRLFNAPGGHPDPVIYTTEPIWLSVCELPDPLCLCPESDAYSSSSNT